MLESQAQSEAVERLLGGAQRASRQLIAASDAQLDAFLIALREAVTTQAAYFAREEARQTGLGNARDKQHKLELACARGTADLLGTKTLGKLSGSPQDTIEEYAHPVGIVVAFVPATNAIPNALFKLSNTVRTRNCLILSYPRSVRALGTEFTRLVRTLLLSAGLPEDAVAAVPSSPDRSFVEHLLARPEVSLILATGSATLLRAAHAAGKPAYGAGPGNVPVWICSDASVEQAAPQIVQSKSYDNGIICGSESNLCVDARIRERFTAELERQGAAVLTVQEKARALDVWFDSEGHLQRRWLGQTARVLAAAASVERAHSIELLVVPADAGEERLLGREKLAPVVSLFTSEHDEAALGACVRLLALEGAGHTAVVHTRSAERARRFADCVPAGRILVNTAAAFGMMGATGPLPFTFMIGTGTWGGTITTDALTWRHLLNIKRLARPPQSSPLALDARL